MSETTTASGERMRELPMTAGNLRAQPCHNCGEESSKRIQFYERYGWVTRYYECDKFRCRKARENAHG
jgi:hypothetical protein